MIDVLLDDEGSSIIREAGMLLYIPNTMCSIHDFHILVVACSSLLLWVVGVVGGDVIGPWAL